MNFMHKGEMKETWFYTCNEAWIWEPRSSGTLPGVVLCLPTFRDNVSAPSSRVKSREDGTDTLFRNVGKQLPHDAAIISQNSADLMNIAAKAWNQGKLRYDDSRTGITSSVQENDLPGNRFMFLLSVRGNKFSLGAGVTSRRIVKENFTRNFNFMSVLLDSRGQMI
jgi:hypothetical protein